MTATQSAVVGAGSALVAALGLWLLLRSRRKEQQPTRWRRAGQLSEILLYPLKSGRGLALQQAECTELGLQVVGPGSSNLRDRFFVIFGEKHGDHKNLKTYPAMGFITLSADEEETVLFQAPGMPDLRINIPLIASLNNQKQCLLWKDDRVGTVDCGEEAARWASRYVLNKDSGLRLGFYLMPVVERRSVEFKAWAEFRTFYKKLRTQDLGAYSDLASYMLLTESSVKDLDSRLDERSRGIGCLQFRPNFVVSGTQPYEDDSWDWIRIGDNAIFRNVKPCVRCTITTLNPETGIRDPYVEPFKTMQKYRKVTDPRAKKIDEDAPAMGRYIGLYEPGRVKVGDPIYVGCD
ncbi:mitochondrial amidoxime-reducing component 1-like [Bacillus rossius redtenbacheri]|uniref:mitochondrial amidoxime-reducing component 1-like n=1 Tax=Bacillus rossius redtenbacheri TaxID=93214 RepID=UPI002FDD0EA6